MGEHKRDPYEDGLPDWDSPLMDEWQAAWQYQLDVLLGVLGVEKFHYNTGTETIDGDIASVFGQLLLQTDLMDEDHHKLASVSREAALMEALERGVELEAGDLVGAEFRKAIKEWLRDARAALDLARKG